jgi:hypothetical protein
MPTWRREEVKWWPCRESVVLAEAPMAWSEKDVALAKNRERISSFLWIKS